MKCWDGVCLPDASKWCGRSCSSTSGIHLLLCVPLLLQCPARQHRHCCDHYCIQHSSLHSLAAAWLGGQ